MGETEPLLAGRYRLGPLLGEGAAARTYRADDVVRGGPVALKLVRDPELEATLLVELEVLGRLVHPHLAPLYDLGRVEGGAYCATEWIDGEQLGDARDWDVAAPALIDVLDALSALHRADVRHGDVKPANILVARGSGRGWLIDLGCAAKLGVARGSVFGTPGFLAPELLGGEPADARADIYAFGQTVQRLAARIGPAPAPWPEVAARCVREALTERPSTVAEVLELLGQADRARSFQSADSLRFVGREAELTHLRAGLSAWHEGRPAPRVTVLAGRPGSGRSRLLQAIKREAQRHHRVVEASPLQAAPIAHLLTGANSPPRTPGMEGVLEALDEVQDPTVWVLDDAEALGQADLRQLRAVLCGLVPGGPLLVWVVDGLGQSAVLEDLSGPSVQRLTLEGLSRSEVGRWCEGRLDETAVTRLFERSGGHPETVRWMLGGDEPRMESRLAALPPPAHAALAEVAASGGAVLTSIDATALAVLLAAGWVKVDAGLVRLALPAYQDVIEASIAADVRREIHRRLANSSEHPADRLRHRAEASLPLGDVPEEPGTDRRWRRAAAALSRSEDPETCRVGARYLIHLGEAPRAIEALGRLLEHDPRDDLARRLLARAHLALEQTDRVLVLLAPLTERGDPLALDLAARAHIKRGEYEEAIACVSRAPAGVEPRAALQEDLGVAKSYLSDPAATAHLRRAEALLATSGTARDRVRVASYLAIDAFRRGELEEAREGYAAALTLVVEHGLDDQLAPAALNLGTVAHQTGDWGAAYRAYRRGHAAARALGQRATLATLELDDAQLYADVGAFARARAASERASTLAEEGGYALLAGAAAAVRVQVAVLEGDTERARRALDEALGHFDRAGATRERDEAWLYELELASLRGEPAPEKRVGTWAADVEVRAWLVEGRLERSVETLERARDAAERQGLGAEVAEADGELARLWAERGAHALAARHRQAARERWERCAAGLPDVLRDDFWRHPRRVSARPATPVTPAAGGRAEKLTRLLSINRALGSTLEVDAVLHQAMDAAVELTGAERGFLVLTDGGTLRVPVARNLAREEVGQAHLEFSRSIAEQAIATGEPVVTVDARQDARFRENQSVHAMKLRSVVAVPIPSPDGPVGALYVDNRLRPGRFENVDAELLMAFADQVAIALRNARLHESLRQQTVELEAERARVVALSEGQAEEIDRLQQRIVEQREVFAHRYDYGALVARSPAMQPLLATLDRVIDSPLTVLVQGESGSGKELVARSAHVHGPGKDGPFVAVNCAALPDTLLESELFGHVRGAFTGADGDRDGLMVSARGGTLFLDEVGEMSLVMQAKLLRVLEQREVRPVGGSRAVAVDFRLVCATNRDLRADAEKGTFREDLYYRIGVVELVVPPLRERVEDIPELVRRILERAAEEMGSPTPTVSRDAMHKLMGAAWPGNVRQLANVLRTALVMSDGGAIEADDLTLERPRPAPGPATTRAQRDARERARIVEALEATDWNVTRAAKRAGVSRATMYRKLDRYGLR